MFHYCKGTKPPFLLPGPPEAHLPSLPSASSRTTDGATSEGSNFPAIFQRSHDWRACAWDDDWLKKKKITRVGIGCAERTRPVRVCASVDQGEEKWAFSSREGTAQSPRATVGPHACTTRPATPG